MSDDDRNINEPGSAAMDVSTPIEVNVHVPRQKQCEVPRCTADVYKDTPYCRRHLTSKIESSWSHRSSS